MTPREIDKPEDLYNNLYNTSNNETPIAATPSDKNNLLLNMLLKSMREFEDALYYKRYTGDHERQKLEDIVADLRRQIDNLRNPTLASNDFSQRRST